MTTSVSEAFIDYNMGKLELRGGLVHLLPAGWAEYGPTFSAAGLVLRDRMPLEDFKRSVRQANRAAMEDNNRALREQPKSSSFRLDVEVLNEWSTRPGACRAAAPSAHCHWGQS
jgi:hypothetical protein